MRIARVAALVVALHLVTASIAGAQSPEPAPPDTMPPDTTTEGVPPGAEVIPGELVSWSIVPATPEGVPADGVSFRLEVEPGATVTQHALLTNHSEGPITFDLAGADGVMSPEGNFDILPPGEESTDIGAWIEIQPLAAVGPGGTVLVPFTITVPADATPGDHPGGIVAGVSRTTEDGEGPRVGFNTRVGVRIHLRVAGEIQPTVAITDLRATYDPSWSPFAPGSVEISYTVTNTGNVRLGSSQQADIAGLFGLPTGADTGEGGVVGQQREILPGQSAAVEATVDDVWPLGRVTTEIEATQQAVGEDTPFTRAFMASASTTAWAVPWTQLGLLLFAVAAIVLWRKRRKVRRARHEAALAEAKAAGAREAAESLAGARRSGANGSTDDADIEIIDLSEEPTPNGSTADATPGEDRVVDEEPPRQDTPRRIGADAPGPQTN